MNARAQAIANENRLIDESTSRAIAAREAEKKPRNAIDAMASRFQINAVELKSTLVKTVFAGCRSESEFLALVVVANEYGLNPLTKEIYAFPAKGGGVVPMVSIDGWIRIMNEHPQFDGIDFNYHFDEKGGLEAVESIIYRKDRSHPVKITEWLDECKRNTDPWNKSPKRMLRHRALMQGARVAFGFSGIVAEDDYIEGNYKVVTTLPSPAELAAHAEAETIDSETGEVFETDASGMTVVDEATARALDAGQDPNAGDADEEGEGQAEAAAQTVKDIDGPLEADDTPPWQGAVDAAINGAKAAKTIAELKRVDTEWLKHAGAVPDDVSAGVDNMINAARQQLTASREG